MRLVGGPNRPRVIQSSDVFVDAARLIYATDYNAGLYISRKELTERDATGPAHACSAQPFFY